MAKYAGGGIKIVTAHSDWFKGDVIPILNEIEYSEISGGNVTGILNLRSFYDTYSVLELNSKILHINADSLEDLFEKFRGLTTNEDSLVTPVSLDEIAFTIPLKNSVGQIKGLDFRFPADANYSTYARLKITQQPEDTVIMNSSYYSPLLGVGGPWEYGGRWDYITKFGFAALRDPDTHELWGLYLINATKSCRVGAQYNPDFSDNPGMYIHLKNLYSSTGGYSIDQLPINPYDQIPWGSSEPDGGNGTYDFSTDQIDPVDIDSIEFTNFIATQAGFVNLYQPSTTQLQRVAYDLMSGWDQLIHIFGTWDKIIVGLGILPVRPNISGYRTPKVGPLTLSTSLAVVSSQYYKLDCGELEIPEIYGSYLDYNPYTKISLYLPYIGVNDIDVDEVMNKTMSILYYVDCYNGNCVANVLVDGSVRYVFSGNCMQEVPVNGESWENVIQAGIAIATAGVGGVVAGAGIAAAETGAAMAAEAAGEQAVGTNLLQLGNASKTASSAAGAVMSAKMIPIRSGSIGQSIGMMSPQKPFIIRTIPKISLPENYAHFKGYPSNIYVDSLGSLSGYTEVDNIILNDLAATEPETDEIYKLLMGGIYI